MSFSFKKEKQHAKLINCKSFSFKKEKQHAKLIICKSFSYEESYAENVAIKLVIETPVN